MQIACACYDNNSIIDYDYSNNKKVVVMHAGADILRSLVVHLSVSTAVKYQHR